MRKAHFTVAGMLLIAACFAVSVSAQTGGVKGKVRNLNGDGISGASVTARLNSKDIQSVEAGRDGGFTLNGLEPGFYNIVVEAKGYAMGIKYNVEVKPGKPRDLGNSLILMVDRGSKVIIRGSVFYKDGTSVPGCEVEVATVDSSGQTRTLTTLMTGISGEFSYIRPDQKATYRFTARFRGVTASKDLPVESAAIYTTSVILPVNRGEKQP